VDIEVTTDYQLSIKRNFFPIKEEMTLNILGDNKQQ